MRHIATVHFIALALALALALAAGGCGEDSTGRLEPVGRFDLILAFGDSLTFGYGASQPRTQSYPAVLSDEINRPVRNAGRPGETSSQALLRLPGELSRLEPELVLLCTGGNDMLRDVNPQTIEDNLRAMIGMIRDSGAQVVLVGVPEPRLPVLLAPLYTNVAVDTDVVLASDVLPRVLGDASLKYDDLHPNAEGYAIIARELADLLRRHGALD